MASKSVILKRKALKDGGSAPGRKDSPHAAFTTRMQKSSSSTPTKKLFTEDSHATPSNSHLRTVSSRSPKFHKIELDKENNNFLPKSTVKSLTSSSKPSLATKQKEKLDISKERNHSVNSIQSHIDRFSKHETVRATKSSSISSCDKNEVVSKMSKTPVICAATALATSTSALARRHRKSVSSDRSSKTSCNVKGVKTASPGRMEKHKMDRGSPVHTTPPKRKPLPDMDKQITGSPSMKSIPNNLVRKMVKNIQEKPPTPPSQRAIGSPRTHPTPSSATRKSLAHQFVNSKSPYRRESGAIANLSKNNENSSLEPEDFSVTVAVRVRPFSQREKDMDSKQVIFMNGNETVVSDGNNSHSFVYDFSFDSVDKNSATEFASQATVYEKLARPLLSGAFNGYNTCLFAYGQTGSGKSYTIMGQGEDVGVVPRFCDEMFSGVAAVTSKDHNVRFHIEMSYFEIYNEKIHDLLTSSTGQDGEKKKQALRMREHPEHGPYVEGLSKFVVMKFDDIQSWLDVGNQQRVTASTGMNDKSSRSHSVFILNMIRTTVEELEGERHESSRRSRINLVDLAGSERCSTAQTSGQRLKEGASINKSLLTLGKVISALAERSSMTTRSRGRSFIPYRDSALTWLLKESLGGNSRTAMIATISPADSHLEETMSTLRYATQARTIVNMVKINEDPNAAIIRELKSEIAKLRAAHEHASVDVEEYRATVREVAQLKEKLAEAENDKAESNTRWRQKLEESEQRKAEEISELKRAGVSFKVDNRLPNLVNLNEDPQLSELLLYVIKHGITRVGRKGGPHECEIQLNGALISDLHCEIINKDEIVTISPKHDNAKIFINGEMIEKSTVLHHSDRVVIAGDHFFRLNHPIEIQRKRKHRPNAGEQKKDFEFAKNELITAQNARMEKEIEQARLRVKQEMLSEIEVAKREAQNEITEQKQQYERVVKTLQTQLEEDEATKKELEVIREEKLVLQKEVDANRRRQDIEAKILAEKTVINKQDILKSQIMTELEAERLKLTRDIERMEKNLKRNKDVKANVSTINYCGKWTPLHVSLLLEEANKISTALQGHTVFTRHDVDEDTIQIKLENTKLGIWTLWSMEKFEEKLEGMREAYDQFRLKSKKRGNEQEGVSDSDDNLFYDPADTWSEVFNAGFTSEPRERAMGCGDNTPTSSKPRQSRRLTRRLSSLTLARTSPALQQSLLQFGHQSNSPLIRRDEGVHPSSLCKEMLQNYTNQLDELMDSPVDLLLLSVNRLSSQCEEIAEGFCSCQDSDGEYMESEKNRNLCFQTTIQLDRCLHNITSFCHTASTGTDYNRSKYVTLWLRQLKDYGKNLAGQVAKLLQGCEGDIEQIVKESSSKIRNLAPSISKCTGALSLATGLSSWILNEDQQHLLSHRMKNAFLQGGDTFLKKIFSGSLNTVKNCSNDETVCKDEKLAKVFKSGISIIKSSKKLQQHLQDASSYIREADLPPYYYQEYTQRVKSMLSEITFLVKSLQDLKDAYMNTVKDQDKVDFDFSDYEEQLRQPALEIARLCASQEGLSSVLNDGLRLSGSHCYSSNNNNSNNTSASVFEVEEENGRLCDEVQSAVDSFIEALLNKNQQLENQENLVCFDETSIDTSGITSRRGSSRSFRRSSVPNRTLATPKSLGSFAIATTVQKWLELADQELSS